jgi:cation:H+ antiporter
LHDALAVLGVLAGAGIIVAGAELFAEHLGGASRRLGISAFALALLLAGAEPEELATTVTASLRHVPAVSFGDVIGSNIAMCLVALPVGALVAGLLPFGHRVRQYALLGAPLGVASIAIAWDGHIGRLGGALLVLAYVGYVTAIWIRERQPPVVGEVGEVQLEAGDHTGGGTTDLAWVFLGVGAMVGGALLLVEGLRSLTHVEATQTDLSLTLIGFATAFELVVLAWSAARRGITEAVVASVVGSFAYNATMSLGAAALARPLRVADASRLHVPLVLMAITFGAVVVLGWRGQLTRRGGLMLLAAYPAFVLFVTLR